MIGVEANCFGARGTGVRGEAGMGRGRPQVGGFSGVPVQLGVGCDNVGKGGVGGGRRRGIIVHVHIC